jgi:hypothetical protein
VRPTLIVEYKRPSRRIAQHNRRHGVNFWYQIWEQKGAVSLSSSSRHFLFVVLIHDARDRQKQAAADQTPPKWKKGDDAPFTNGHPGYNFSRPQRPLSRPGTSYASQNPSSFRAPFAMNPEASSSMVELAPPSARRPSLSSLRAVSSNPSLKGGRPKISGPIGPPVPLPMTGDGSRPGTATRPGTSSSMKKEWVNPLDVHFAKDMSSFGTSSGNRTGSGSIPKSPLAAQAEFWLGPGGDDKPSESGLDGSTGYPSPPQSVKSSDQGYGQNSSEAKGQSQTTRPAAPSNLRRVNTAEETRLPSPADSEGRGDGLMIQNGSAKRETMNFHGPKRTDESARKQWKEKSELEKLAIKRRRQTEGFEGNFAAFNFGGVDLSMPMPSTSPDSVLQHRPMSPAGSKDTASTLEKRSTGESAHSDSMTSQDTSVEHQKSPQKPAVKPLDPWTDALPQIPPKGHSKQAPSEVSSHRSYETQSLHSMASRSIHARGDSDTRAPGTPTALRVFPSVSEQAPASPQSQHRGRGTDSFDAPPRLDPDRRPQSPLRAKGPMEGDFPMSKGLPRGRRPPPNPITVPPSTTGLKPPTRPAREDETSSSLPSWADRAERHLSAIPAPLTPLGNSPSFNDGDLNPWAANTGTSSPLAPRLPSPTFPSLKKSISGTDNLTSGFEMSFEEEIANSLSHHMLSDLGSPTSFTSSDSRRVEKKTAPPRPPPITLPPGKNGPGGGTPTSSLKSPVNAEFSSGFI